MQRLQQALTLNQPVDYVVVGTSGKDSILTARQLSPSLRGPSGRPTNNLVIGLDGNDTLTAGPGKDFLYGGTGNNTLYGNTGNNSGQIDVLVGGPGSTLPQSPGTDTISAGSGDDVMIGDDAKTTFNVNNKQFSQSFNIIWGDNKIDTYNFTGNSIVYLVDIANPTIQSVEQYASSIGSFNSFFQTVTGFAPGGVDQGQAETIIINPNASDTLVLNGNTIKASQLMAPARSPVIQRR